MLNTAQKAIVLASKIIDEETNGEVNISYYMEGSLLKWNLYDGNQRTHSGWTTAEAAAFVHGWQLAKRAKHSNA